MFVCYHAATVTGQLKLTGPCSRVEISRRGIPAPRTRLRLTLPRRSLGRVVARAGTSRPFPPPPAQVPRTPPPPVRPRSCAPTRPRPEWRPPDGNSPGTRRPAPTQPPKRGAEPGAGLSSPSEQAQLLAAAQTGGERFPSLRPPPSGAGDFEPVDRETSSHPSMISDAHAAIALTAHEGTELPAGAGRRPPPDRLTDPQAQPGQVAVVWPLCLCDLAASFRQDGWRSRRCVSGRSTCA